MNVWIILFTVNWWYLASSQASGSDCSPLSKLMRNPLVGMNKHLGSSFEFRCKSICNGSYKFWHYNHTREELDLVHQSDKNLYKIPSLSFDDGGEYCCSQQCDDKSITSDFQKCCTRIKISPMVEWDLPKAVGLHGAPINGSCSVTAYPRPHVIVITPFGCDNQQESIHIGEHTNKVVFTIHNATKSCEEIHCLISTFGELNSTELLIIENVSCGSKKRQAGSTPVNMLTAFQRGDSMITSRRLNIDGDYDAENDYNTATHATANGSPITICSKLIMPIALLLPMFYI